MNDPEALVTSADLDKAGATVTVVPTAGAPSGAAPAVDTTTAPAAVQTEAPDGGGAPAEPPAPPDWFVKEKTKLQRQRRDADRRAERLAAELDALRRTPAQPQQKQSTELRPQDFPNYDAFVEAKIEAKTEEKIGAFHRSRSEQEAQGAVASLRDAFVEKASEQAEAADIDLDAVMETLGQAPLLSPTVLEHLAKSDHTARLAEYLAENPSELDRVSRLGPALAKKSLAKVEASFGTAKPAPNVTNAPPPPPKVGGRTVTQKDWRSSDDMDAYAAGWKKEREAQSS